MERKLVNVLANEGKDFIEALCAEYHLLLLIKEDGSYHSILAPKAYEYIVEGFPDYNDALNEFCDKYVRDKDRTRIKDLARIEYMSEQLKNSNVYETTFQTKDLTWVGCKCYEISFENQQQRTFLFGIIEFGNEIQEERRNISANEIIKTLSEEFHMIYRINLYTGEYEVVIMNLDNPEFVYGFTDFYELEKVYFKYGFDEEYVGTLPGEDNKNARFNKPIRLDNIKEYYEIEQEPIVGYYKEKNGRWLKLTVTPDENYSKENPYIIYAIRKCDKEIEDKSRNIIFTSAVAKMYCFVGTIDIENGTYDCIHSEDWFEADEIGGSLKHFMNTMKRMIYEEDFCLFESLINEIASDTVGFVEREYRVEDEQGMFHFHNAFATYIMVPEGGRILLLVRNVDERAANRARMESLNEEYSRAKDLLYALGDSYFGIYYFNIEKRLIIASRQGDDIKSLFNEYTEYDDLLNNYIKKWVHPEDCSMVRSFAAIDNISDVLREEGQSVFCEFQRMFDNEYKWVRMVFQAIKCIDGRPVSVIMAFKDIHDEREMELRHKRELREALISAKLASEAKSRFLSNMSHDIRTPMNAIMGMTSIALTHIDDKERVQSCLDKINISANHLLRLINEVLDMSYIESGKITIKSEPFNLIELMKTVAFIMQEQFDSKNQTFTTDFNGIVNNDLLGDRVRIQQILLNVLGNAAKYTPKGGNIRFTSKEINTSDNGVSYYKFIVSDTGKGMSEEFIKNIFKPFEREEKIEDEIEGSGLGMAISKSIVDLMKGDIEIESEPEKGSTVTITIPFKHNVIKRNQQETYTATDSSDNQYAVLRGKKILVVDDNEINCDIACDYLEDAGVITDVAINGKEAYNIISSGEFFDAVLMDIRMPVMNGYEATRKIRKIGSEYAKEIPIIAMTANAFEEDVQMSVQMGMNAHISKPLSADMMYSTLTKVFVGK